MAHAPGKCFAGLVWHAAQSAEVWAYTVFANATPGVWHDAHTGPKCRAGAAWHFAQSFDEGWEKDQRGPGRWHVAHSPRGA
jgi:hypothetical protein